MGVVDLALALWLTGFLHTSRLLASGNLQDWKCPAVYLSYPNGGSIKFPLGNRGYANSASCEWTLGPSPPGMGFQLTFHMLSIEDSAGCSFDSLSLLGGNRRVLKKYCGRTLRSEFFPLSNLTLKFASDSIVGGDGFNLTFTYRSEGESAPASSSALPAGQSTAVTTAPTSLSFTTSTTTKQPTTTVTVPKGTACPTWHLQNATGGTLRYPFGFEFYPRFIQCEWTIGIRRPNTAVKIVFSTLDIENDSMCSHDYLKILSPTGMKLDQLCGSLVPPPMTYPYNQLLLQFTSNYENSGRGFEFNYNFVSVSPTTTAAPTKPTAPPPTNTQICLSAHVPNGTIGGSINFPSSTLGSLRSLRCDWLIKTVQATAQIEFLMNSVYFERCPSGCCTSLRIMAPNNVQLSSPLPSCGGNLSYPVVDIVPYSSTTLQFSTQGSTTVPNFVLSYYFIVPPIRVAKPTYPCGVPLSLPVIPRIVGGSEARPGSWPWMVFLQVKVGSSIYVCGGSVFADQWILTAAHCLRYQTGLADSILVRIGSHNLRTRKSTEKWLVADSYIIHPEHNPEIDDNDIALIKLPEPAGVPSVCIQSADETWPDQTYAIATGWGMDVGAQRDPPSALYQVTLLLLSATDCRNLHKNRLTPNMICAGYILGGRDTCQGDSGGPLMARRSDGSYALVGITSWGSTCAERGRPGVYTKVANYAQWIRSQVQPKF